MSGRGAKIRLLFVVLWVCLAPPVVKAAEPPAFRPSTPVVKKLANGLTVAVFQKSRLPIVQMQLLVSAGTGADPPEFGGTAHMTAEMLRRGTSSRNAEAFAQQVDRLGGNLVASASRDYSTIEARFLARDFEAGLELMSDAAINPLLAEEDLKRAKTETYSALAQILQDAGNLADEQIWLTVFKGPPYGRTPYGTPESLQRLSSEQLRNFYFAHYRPAAATLAIAGDVTPERAFAAAEESFGGWTEKGEAPPAPPGTPGSTPSVRIRLVDVPGQRETQLRLGLPAPPRASPDELAFSLANARFGSGPSSRLADLGERGVLRRESRSAYVPLKGAGLVIWGTATANDSVGASVQALQAELRRLVTEPPDESELAPIRRTAARVYPMQFETLGGILGHWSGTRFYGLPEGGERFAERIGSLSAADVAGSIRRWIRPEGVSIVAVGPASQIRAQLEPFGTVEVVRADGTQAAPQAAAEPPAAATSAQVARGRQIVKQAVAAHGGLQRLRGIKDSTVEADATLEMGGRKVEGKFVQIRKEPFRMLFSTSFASFVTQQILNGERAWSITGPEGNERSLDSLGLAGMRSGFGSDVPHLLLAAADPTSQVSSRGRERIEGRDADKVEVRSGRDYRMLYFDATTHQLLAMDQHEARESRGTFAARRLYRDYRPVNGIPWPYVEERLMDGEPVMVLNVKKVVVNAGLDDAIFEKADAPLLPPAR